MKEEFEEIKFKAETLRIIAQADAIIADYQRQNFTLTLRQLYYQFVQQNLIPNTQKSYKRLGSIIDKGRKAGLLDWSAIEDRQRNLEELPTWDRPGDFMLDTPRWYREDPWLTQDVYLEVWIEKDSLTGVISGVCNSYQVPYFACKGYVSQSEMYDAAKRMVNNRGSRRAIVLHLGDHDPSGIHMSVDNQTRLDLFSYDHGIELRRLALNRNQVDSLNLPPNPAKQTDSRFREYSKIHGRKSWELDALNPTYIAKVIKDAITDFIDPDPWNEAVRNQERRRALVQLVADNWTEAVIHVATITETEVDEEDF